MNQSINTSERKRKNKHKDKKRLSKDRVVHQFKEIFFKIIFCSGRLTSVEVDVAYQPWQSIERQNTMDLSETRSQFQLRL